MSQNFAKVKKTIKTKIIIGLFFFFPHLQNFTSKKFCSNCSIVIKFDIQTNSVMRKIFDLHN